MACGTIQKAVDEARFRNPEMPVEVEVESIGELQEALDAKANRILLDNFTIQQLEDAVNICSGTVPLEASGGITLDNIGVVASTGIDRIAVGAITHSATAVDIALDR